MALATSIIRSARLFQRISNYSRDFFNVQPSFPIQRPQQAGHLAKWYASSAATEKTLHGQLNRLNIIVRKGDEIKWHDVEVFKEILSKNVVLTSSQATEIIQYCGNAMTNVEPAKRQRLLNELVIILDNQIARKTISFYNTVLKAYVENEHTFSATDFLADLEKKGITPNSVTYQHLISTCCRRGDMVGANHILQLMHSKQMPITAGICNDFILGHINADDMTSAYEVIGIMRKDGRKLTSQMFANLLKGYARVDDVAGIERTFERFKEEKVDLLNEDVINSICELAENGHSNSAESLIKYLHSPFDFNLSATDRLIRARHEEIIPKILVTTDDNSRQKLAKHCMMRMVQNECSAERVNNIWKALESFGWNLSTHMDIFKVGLHSESPELILAILKQMKIHSISISENEFRTLLRLEGRKGMKNLAGLLEVMKTEYGVNISSETLRENVLPFLDYANNPLLAIAKLQMAGIPQTHVIQCLVSRCLRDNNIKVAYQVVSKYNRFYWQWERFGNDLIVALQNTNDVEYFVNFLRSMYESVQTSENETARRKTIETGSDAVSGTEFIGRFLYKTVSELKEDRVRITNEILNGLISHGLSISSQYGAKITNALGDDLTPDISKSMERLCSNELKPRPLEKNTMVTDFGLLTSTEILSMISKDEAEGKTVDGLKKLLLHAHLRENNIPEAEELIELFEAKGLLNNGNYVMIISMYARAGNDVKALSTFNRLKERHPNFIFTSVKKITEVLQALLDNGAELSKIQGFLDANRRSEPLEDNVAYHFDHLLLNLAEGGDAALVNGVYESLIENKFIVPTNENASALVKVHLVKNNLSEAISVFEKTVNEIRKAPLKQQIYLKLIEAKDLNKIQHIVDLDTKVFDESSALHNLAYAYAASGMTQHTRNILERKSLSSKPELLRYRCEHAFNCNDVEVLKTLLEATRGLNYDRQSIFYNLLLSYRRDNKVEEALDLWHRQMEEDLIPSPEFEHVLGQFLKDNDVEPPFKFDSKQIHVPKPKSNATQQINEKTGTPPLEQYNEWKQMKSSEEWDLKILSNLVFMLLEKEHLDEANEIALDIFARNKPQFKTIFKLHLRSLAASCNYGVLDKISKLSATPMRDHVQFEKYYIKSYANGNAGEEYLQKMNARIVNAGSEKELKYLRQSMPTVGLLNLLQKQPQLLDEYTRLAEEWFKKKIYGPMNILWLYHCIAANNLSAGERIWTKYFVNASSEQDAFMNRLAKEVLSGKKMEKLQKQLVELTENRKASSMYD